MKWHPEDRALALHLYAQGMSASRISARTGKSRNAIIGLAHRAGIKHGNAMVAKLEERVAALRIAP